MKRINAFLVAGIILIIGLLGILVWNSYQQKEVQMGSVPSGEQTIFSTAISNKASVSCTADDDIVLYSGDPTASLSAGERIQFTGTSELAINYNYFVKTATSSSGFEVASTSGGTVLDIASDCTGGEFFYETPVGERIDVSQSGHYTISIAGEEQPTGTLKIVGSISDFKPDFLASPSSTNMYENIDVDDVQTQTSIDGDTGISFTGTTDYRTVSAFGNAYKWLSVIFETLTSGSYTVKINSSD